MHALELMIQNMYTCIYIVVLSNTQPYTHISSADLENGLVEGLSSHPLLSPSNFLCVLVLCHRYIQIHRQNKKVITILKTKLEDSHYF